MADPSEEDFSQLPLPDRFTHKNWKVRKEGYEAAAKEFARTPAESDPVFKPFLQDSGLWKDAAGDSNVAAQQEGLGALCAFLKFGGPQAASRTRGLTIEPIREKGLSSTRPAAKAAALEAVLLYVEIDKPDYILEELLPALSHKQPKVIAATLAAITAIVHNFGCRVVDPKSVLKTLPKVFGHADKNVRAEATNLTVELYRWLKEAIKAVFWNDLKPVQQQDLEKQFEKIKEEPSPKQERLTRLQQAAAAVASDGGGPDGGGDGGTEEMDGEEAVEINAFDLAEPVDIFPSVPKDLHENLASTKWKERKDALDALLIVLSTPRIKDGHFDDIIRDMARIILKDSNVAVVATAANCVEKLALGIRTGFAKYRSTILSPMLERLKEKKQAVADALGAALDAVFAATSLSDCLDEIATSLAHKNPQVKLETVKFLARCLKNTRDVPLKAEVKLIADAATKLLSESTEVMRSGGAEILGILMKILGERAMGPYMEGIDDIRKAKIKEFFDTAVVKAKERPKPAAPPPKAAGTSALGKKVAPSGMKKPLGVKKAASASVVPLSEEEHVPTKPQATARSLAKPGLMRPGSSAPTSAASKLSGLKRPATSGIASPQRRVMSPPMTIDEDVPTASPAKFGLGGRGGLAGRSLAKPAPPTSTAIQETNPATQSITSGLSVIERAELEELRLERDRLSHLTDSLRSSNAKLSAEITELQNQNAQLIEDHTRDVLQIKAKETQLVRARGECDVLRGEIESAKKDIERQKREMSRLGRESFGRDQRETSGTTNTTTMGPMGALMSPPLPEEKGTGASSNGNGIYSDVVNGTGVAGGSILSRTTSSASSATGRNSASGRPGAPQSLPSYRSVDQQQQHGRFEPNHHLLLHSPSEEKENNTAGGDGNGNVLNSSRRKISPSAYGGAGGGGMISPQRANSSAKGTAAAVDAGSNHAGAGAGAGAGEPAENWKRAAEVTSQLKARIEQMKARQGISRPH